MNIPTGLHETSTEQRAKVESLADAAPDAFAEHVVQAGAAVRLRALLGTSRPDTLYHVPDRNGISVVAVPSTSLTAREVADLLAFRFAQYLDIGFVDRQIACAQDMRREPATVVAPGDVHVVAGVRATGEILCYAVIEQPPTATPGCRLRSGERELFSVERVHGAGVFDRLPILPDLAVSKIRELGRFVRNHRPVAGRDLATRAVVETGVAAFRLLIGPLRLQVDAVVGDLEEHVAKQNLDFFHVPSVVVHGTVPYATSASYLYPRYQLHTVYPFACLTSDIETALPRLGEVERALEEPGKRGLLALLRLRSRGGAAASMLRGQEGADPLDELSLLQPQTSMPQRSLLLEQGQWLRQQPPFAGLSVAEAAMLCALMRRVEVPAGDIIARQGETAEALYIVESGHARMELADQGATVDPVGTLGPGQCCGLFGVLAGAEHPVNIIAATAMTLLRLSKAHHDTYLVRLPGVDQRLGYDALHRLAEVDRHRRLHPAQAVSPGGDGSVCGEGCACEGHDHSDVPDAPSRHDQSRRDPVREMSVTRNPYAAVWSIDERDFPDDGADAERLRFTLRYAILAPSGHNGQPWRFHIDGDVLYVYADRSRALPTIDPYDRELLISCAATIHLTRVALEHFGYHPDVQLLPDLVGDPDLLATVRLGQRGGPPATRDLFDAVRDRHSNRHPYQTRPVPADQLAQLAAAATAEAAWLQPVTDRPTRAAMADLIAEGDRIKWREDVFRHELAERIIPNRGRRRDGMPGYAFGVPGPLARLAPYVVSHVDLGRLRARSDRTLALATPVLAVIGTARDDPAAWMAAGQAMSHVLLRATADGLATSFLSQAIEVPALRPRLTGLLSTDGYPQVLLRVGYPRRQARPAPRRPLRDVLIPTGSPASAHAAALDALDDPGGRDPAIGARR